MKYQDPRSKEIYDRPQVGFLKSGLHSKYLIPIKEKQLNHTPIVELIEEMAEKPLKKASSVEKKKKRKYDTKSDQ